MVYVALLRGINVGGNNKVEMKRLKETFLRVGMESVSTYINSGNVIFVDDQYAKPELSALLEKAILEDFGLEIRVLIRSLDEYDAMMKVLPESWTNGDEMKSDVLFLWDEADPETVSSKLPSKPEIETVVLAPGAILWSVARKDVTRSGLVKIVGTALYKQMTVRNVNSARKIHALMKNLDEDPE